MEPAAATSFPVARDPPARPALQTAKLGQGLAQRGWGRWAFVATMLLVTGSFPLAVYQARHSRRDLALVIVTYYLIAVLCCCLRRLNLLRRDDPAAAPERRRVRIIMQVFLVALGIMIAARLALVMPNLWLKIAVSVITGMGIGLSLYFFPREDAGRRQTQDRDLQEVSPEQRV